MLRRRLTVTGGSCLKVGREALYAEVRAEPMTTVAARYGLSSNFLARVCERLNVPRPPRGFWAKLKVGAKVRRVPLPAPRIGDELEWCRNGEEPTIYTDGGSSNSTRAKRGKQHPLLVGVAHHFEVGRVRAHDSEKYLRPYKQNLVDIFSSKACLQRALATANKLFFALEDRGYRVMLAPSDGRTVRLGLHHRAGEAGRGDSDYRYVGNRNRPTVVLVGAVMIGLSLFEISERIEVRYVGGDERYVPVGSREDRLYPRVAHDWTTHEWRPSGRLGLHAYAPTTSFRWERYWREEKGRDLTSFFAEIGDELAEHAPVITQLEAKARQDAEEQRIKWEREREEAAKKDAERRRVDEEKARFEAFKTELTTWRFTHDARAFVGELRELVRSRGLRISRGGPLEEWIAWIEERTLEVDPLAKLRKNIDEMASKHRTRDRRASPLGAHLRQRRRRAQRWQ